jgi:hypothetical protein
MLAKFYTPITKSNPISLVRHLSGARSMSSFPKIVQVSLAEKSSGALTWKNLELATRALHHDGLVVIENAVSHSKLDMLNERMVKDALILQSAGDASPYNYNKG